MSVPLRIEHCLAEAPEIRRRKPRKSRMSLPCRRLIGVGAISAILSVLGLAAFGAITLIHGIGASLDLPLAGPQPNGKLSAVMAPAHRSNGYVNVVGSVTNTGGSRAVNVEAVVELLDSSNRTVQMDRGMIAFSAIPTGASAPFSVIVPDDAGAVGYRITFRHPDGRAIE